MMRPSAMELGSDIHLYLPDRRPSGHRLRWASDFDNANREKSGWFVACRGRLVLDASPCVVGAVLQIPIGQSYHGLAVQRVSLCAHGRLPIGVRNELHLQVDSTLSTVSNSDDLVA